jgi:hypothetical protein
MAATVVDGSISAANWIKNKPQDYQGGGNLEAAIKSYETLNKKDVSFAALPTLPDKQSITAYTKCAKELKESSDELTKVVVAHLKALSEAANKVAGAANATSSELSNLAKNKKGDDKKKYDKAASSASAIALQATTVVQKLK